MSLIKKYTTAIEKLSFCLANFRTLSSMECGKTRNCLFHNVVSKII